MKYIATYATTDSKNIIESLSTKEDTYTLGKNDIEVTKSIYCVLTDLIISGKVEVTDTSKILENVTDYTYTVDGANTLYTIYLAPISDRNSVRYIIGVRSVSSIETWNPNLFVMVTKAMFDYLSTKDMEMAVSKVTLKDSGSAILSQDDILIISDENLTDLQVLKVYLKNKALELTKTRLDDSMSYYFFDFVINNNKLAAAGFIVTEENREDKYLEIVNKNDAALLDTLSLYLEALDKLSIYNKYYSLYKTFLTNLDATTTIDAANTLFTTFQTQFK
jgi:hypothetical protein